MDRLNKAYQENKRAFQFGSAFMAGAATAFYIYKRRSAPPAPTRWVDPHFKSENLALYSTEAEVRAKQLQNVSYRLVLNLAESEE